MNTEVKIKWIDEYIEQAMEIAWLEGYERALLLLQRLLFEEPGYARLHNALGMILVRYADEPRQAELHFRMAIRFAPDFSEPYGHLANLLAQDERHDETIEVCVDGLKAKRADKASLMEAIGSAWELKRKYAKAIRSYREALGYSAESWKCMTLEESIKRCKRKQRK